MSKMIRQVGIQAKLGTFGGVTVSKLDLQTYTSEFESHWVPHSFGLVPRRTKELRKLLFSGEMFFVKKSSVSKSF